MKAADFLKVTVMVLGFVVAGLVIASLLDILIAVLRMRFYTEVAFVVTFCVAGIFTTCIAYISISENPQYKSTQFHYLILLLLAAFGLLFFFLLSKIEGGEYEVAFKGFGAALSLSTLLFLKRK